MSHLNIDSKRYNIRSNGFGGYVITDRTTNERKTVPVADVPANALGVIHEREFDKIMKRLLSEN